VAGTHPQSVEIQTGLAKGAVNALNHSGEHGRWEDFAAWGETLRTVAEAHPQSVEIQTELAKAAVNALNHSGEHGRWEDFAAWGETLRGVAEAHPQSVEIQTRLAKGAVNALSHCGEHGRWENFAAWGETLRGVAEAHPQSVEIQTELANGATNAIVRAALAGREEDVQKWGAILRGALPERLASAEQAQDLQRIFDALHALHASLPHPAVGAVIALMKERFTRRDKEETGGEQQVNPVQALQLLAAKLPESQPVLARCSPRWPRYPPKPSPLWPPHARSLAWTSRTCAQRPGCRPIQPATRRESSAVF